MELSSYLPSNAMEKPWTRLGSNASRVGSKKRPPPTLCLLLQCIILDPTTTICPNNHFSILHLIPSTLSRCPHFLWKIEHRPTSLHPTLILVTVATLRMSKGRTPVPATVPFRPTPPFTVAILRMSKGRAPVLAAVPFRPIPHMLLTTRILPNLRLRPAQILQIVLSRLSNSHEPTLSRTKRPTWIGRPAPQVAIQQFTMAQDIPHPTPFPHRRM